MKELSARKAEATDLSSQIFKWFDTDDTGVIEREEMVRGARPLCAPCVCFPLSVSLPLSLFVFPCVCVCFPPSFSTHPASAFLRPHPLAAAGCL